MVVSSLVRGREAACNTLSVKKQETGRENWKTDKKNRRKEERGRERG